MAVTKNVKLTLNLTNGKKAFITLPEFINASLSHPDTGDDYTTPACVAKIVAAYETSQGVGVSSVTFDTIQTTTNSIAVDVAPSA